jgi:Ca2+-binding RTX toxin-like protein
LVLAGGLGNDQYQVTSPLTRLIEEVGEGKDEVMARIDFSLRAHSQHIENLTLVGDENIQATGNGQDNVINGNAGDNLINGGWGNDILFGADGDDLFKDQRGAERMIGGKGNDTYHVDHSDDVIVEHGGEGHDVVYSAVSLALRSFGHAIEELRLTGEKDLNGTGNNADNVVRGNRGDNLLFGGSGDDLLAGGAGDDHLCGDEGADRLIGGAGSDTFQFKGAWGRDIVDDFDPLSDRIDLSLQSTIADARYLLNHCATQTGRAVVIDDGEGNTITLRGTELHLLSEDHFLF